MRTKKKFTVIAFETTTQAMAMEKMCGEKNIKGRLIPLPPQIDAGCGLAWRMDIEEFAVFKDIILSLPQGIEGIAELELYF